MGKEVKPSLLELKARRMKASAKKKAAEAEIEEIDSQLLLLIPREEVAEGLKHVFYEKASPSWKNITEKIVREVVPASRRQVAETIIAEAVKASTKAAEYIQVVG